MLFPLYYCPGRSAGAGSPGRRRPSFERDPPATPHPGRWLPHGTHLPFSFRRKSVDPHAPRNDSAKALQSEFANIPLEPRTFAGLRTVAASKQEAPLLFCESRCISEQAPRCRCESLRIWEGGPTFMWGRSASASFASRRFVSGSAPKNAPCLSTRSSAGHSRAKPPSRFY